MKKAQAIFFHPDFTVGSGFAPDQSLSSMFSESRASTQVASSPPVRNYTLP